MDGLVAALIGFALTMLLWVVWARHEVAAYREDRTPYLRRALLFGIPIGIIGLRLIRTDVIGAKDLVFGLCAGAFAGGLFGRYIFDIRPSRKADKASDGGSPSQPSKG